MGVETKEGLSFPGSHGIGKSKSVLVFAQGEKEKEAMDAGADFVGADDLVAKIQGGWTDFDVAIATPNMTTTNHPPFAYDVDGYGFPRQDVKAKLPKSIPTDKATIDQLGHIWYADKVMGQFIDETQKQDPSALFVVTGDHAERFNFATDVSLPELSGIPCFIYGDGVTKDLLAPAVAGSHLQIMSDHATPYAKWLTVSVDYSDVISADILQWTRLFLRDMAVLRAGISPEQLRLKQYEQDLLQLLPHWSDEGIFRAMVVLDEGSEAILRHINIRLVWDYLCIQFQHIKGGI